MFSAVSEHEGLWLLARLFWGFSSQSKFGSGSRISEKKKRKPKAAMLRTYVSEETLDNFNFIHCNFQEKLDKI